MTSLAERHYDIRARVVVNATGIFADKSNGLTAATFRKTGGSRKARI